MLLLKNATVLSAAGEPFLGDVAVENGKIVSVGPDLSANGAQVWDLTGCYLTPGFIDAHCHIGMWEDGMGFEGEDGNEMSEPITPQMRAIDGLNPFDPCFREAREAGITTVVTGPGSANVIGGEFVALKTSEGCIEDRVVLEPAAMKAAMGENPKRVYHDNEAMPYTRMAIAALLRQTLVDAEEYGKKIEEDDEDKLPERELGKEALLRVLHGEELLKVHAHRADDILTALRIAREFDLRLSIEHCTEGHLIPGILKKQVQEIGAHVIVGPLLTDRSKIELKNQSIKAPAILHEAGIEFAIMTDHPCVPIQYLPVCAALAAREGLPEEIALRAITINAARAVGMEDRLGSIEIGKDADIAVFDGHPFEFRTHCVTVFIDGEPVHDMLSGNAAGRKL